MPLILCNYHGFYDGLIKFFKSCDTNGTLAAPELKDIILADSNEEVTALGLLLQRADTFIAPTASVLHDALALLGCVCAAAAFTYSEMPGIA